MVNNVIVVSLLLWLQKYSPMRFQHFQYSVFNTTCESCRACAPMAFKNHCKSVHFHSHNSHARTAHRLAFEENQMVVVVIFTTKETINGF